MIGRLSLPSEVRNLCSVASSRGCRRCTVSSTQHKIHSYVRRLSSSVVSTSVSPHEISLPELPRFLARGRDLKVLYEPSEFYKYLLKSIRRARKRIFLASLYIGREETELVGALHSALQSNPNLQLHILVDYLRSTREHPQSISSASLLGSLQASFPNQVKIALYHTPALSGVLKKLVPKRYNEGWGLWHGKIYGFDDNIVISGANLSRDYFTNRQDRYIAIHGHAPLADYFHALIQGFATISYRLQGYTTSSGPTNFLIKWQNLTHALVEPLNDPQAFTIQAKTFLKEFCTKYFQKSPSSLSSPRYPVSDLADFDTLIQPFLQMGPFTLLQETQIVVPKLLEEAGKERNFHLDWTSGYFSVRKEYREGLLRSDGPVNIVCASPEANGFYQSAGFSRYIPPAYTYLEHVFWEEMQRMGKNKSIDLREWKRKGWTYHSKGIWLSPRGHEPTLTVVGSSNYGYRSAVRDLEVNLIIQTFSPDLRRELAKEIEHIGMYAVEKVDEALFAKTDRKVGWINKLAARMISNML